MFSLLHAYAFLPRDAMLTQYMLPSCVRLSATRRYCTQMAKRRITHTTPYDSSRTLVCWCQRSRRNSNGVTPNRGAKQCFIQTIRFGGNSQHWGRCWGLGLCPQRGPWSEGMGAKPPRSWKVFAA